MTDPAEHETGPIYLDATLRPHRSLSKRGFVLVMAGVAGGGFLIGTAFFMAGAWPVAGFAGLEILLVYIAFRMNFRDGDRAERLVMTDRGLDILRIAPSGRTTEQTRLEPAWLSVEMDDPPRHESRLLIRGGHGLVTEIGRFLQPEEKVEVAAALREALARYRSAPAGSPAG
jgi:uncharacterized membrane protein